MSRISEFRAVFDAFNAVVSGNREREEALEAEVERLRGFVAELRECNCADERLKIRDLESDYELLLARCQRFQKWAQAVVNAATFDALMTGEDM